MDTNKTTTSSGMLEGAEYEKKLKQYYGDMLVYKSSANSKFFSALSLPSFYARLAGNAFFQQRRGHK